ncbi:MULTISPECIES: DUF2905 domain-containing protein [Oceanobacillus]|uniref:DUF2905 domain-containing protein n=2 Tax=Oceanobacillus TaxID=182709 RepID=A0A0A1MET6_9BACI|nr:DUF2905 domain-containing protein [Oceanobacillus oncorhynchi]MDM8100443.1 DUF2905 domain-containing protein [Oceanobacillus oncorhynchi]UUI38213.1 DUF2905 domain-containing protein [Oceanobacillus oncorhynchi]CEI83875.1 hypothetical protein BN997_03799 [Oceanobacillus oncorhynchi]
MGKLFIIAGIVLIIIGLIWTFIGRLPGDFTFQKGNMTFHFPLMTSILVSVILTLILFIISRFR